jgi:hypothetical protein
MQVKFTVTGTEPISLEEAKLHLKADYEVEDSLITNLIVGVRERIQEFTGISLIEQTIEYFDETIEDEIELPYPPHAAITELKLNGTDSDAYTKTGLTQFIIKPQNTFLSGANDEGFYCKYTATSGATDFIKNEMLKAIEEAYRNRGNSSELAKMELSENTYANLAHLVKL